MAENQQMGQRALITYYKQLIKKKIVSEKGSTYKRMVELETRLNNKTGQASSYGRDKKNDKLESLRWLNKVMN